MSQQNIPTDIKKEELLRKIDEFKEKIQNGTSDPDNFITFTEIEHLWADLMNSTQTIYSDMLQDLLNDADEAEIISKKKQNTKTKE